MKIEFPDEIYTEQWEGIDWEAAERKPADWQAELTIAAFRRDDKAIQNIQRRIVRDLDIKCLAVRHVASSGSGPGVDGVRWKTPAEKMRAAMSLTSKDYHASPLRQINIIAKNTGKERKQGLPVYFDRAMSVLYGYSLIPVIEAQAERKSFAFRDILYKNLRAGVQKYNPVQLPYPFYPAAGFNIRASGLSSVLREVADTHPRLLADVLPKYAQLHVQLRRLVLRQLRAGVGHSHRFEHQFIVAGKRRLSGKISYQEES